MSSQNENKIMLVGQHHSWKQGKTNMINPWYPKKYPTITAFLKLIENLYAWKINVCTRLLKNPHLHFLKIFSKEGGSIKAEDLLRDPIRFTTRTQSTSVLPFDFCDWRFDYICYRRYRINLGSDLSCKFSNSAVCSNANCRNFSTRSRRIFNYFQRFLDKI